MKNYADPTHIGNNTGYHTGKACIEDGCNEPAGTLWGPYWCFKHNIKRIDRINKQFNLLEKKLAE